MKVTTPLFFIIVFFISLKTFAQTSSSGLGLKAGANYARFTSNKEADFTNDAEFKYKTGFYAGGFLNYEISKKFQFQPELLIALQGSKIETTVESRRGFETNPTISTFKATTNELSLLLPLEFRFLVTDRFFLEAGPQLVYVLDRKEVINENPYSPNGGSNGSVGYDYDKFDFGFNVGTGFQLSDDLAITGRFFRSLIERDDTIKSSIFSLGMEYEF